MTDKPTPRTLRNWKAKRAGGRITVYGTDIDTGAATKITNIDEINPPSSHAAHEVEALDKHGTVHRLIFA